MKSSMLILALFLTGCVSSSGVVPMGKDTYIIKMKNSRPGFGTGDEKLYAFKEGAEFCQKDGKKFQIVNTNEIPSGPAQFGSAEVQFMCLDEKDRELARPKMQAVPNQRIEIKTGSN